MCQVYVATKDRQTALMVAWLATSCHLVREQLLADYSEIDSQLTVDLEIGTHTPAEIEAALAARDLPLTVREIEGRREFPRDPEVVRNEAIQELRRVMYHRL